MLNEAPVHLGKKQQQLLAALMLFANRQVSADVLVDYLWNEELPTNPLNSLQDVVKRFRNVLGDEGRKVLITRGRDYSLMLGAGQFDIAMFGLLANAGLALETASPSFSRVLLGKALEIAQGELPDAEPGSRIYNEVEEIERLRLAAAHAFQRTSERPPAVSPPLEVFESSATGLGVRISEVDDLVLAGVICDIVKFHGVITRFGDGLLLAMFSGAGDATRCASAISDQLAGSDALLGGAICRLRPGGSSRCMNRLMQLVGAAAPGQILVPTNIRQAAASAGASLLLRPIDEDLWQIAGGPERNLSGMSGPSEVPMVGREETIVEIAELLRHHRLITLRGPGGIGKTRIAWELVGRVSGNFADGVCFVDLAEADHHGGPLSLVVRTLGFVPEPFRHPETTLVDLLGTSERLLVLDNCEQFIEEMRSLCEAIGDACPSITILATSRSALGGSRELLRDIGELDLIDAAHLLVALAFSDGPGQPPDPFNPMILGLCSQLDSVPLAIECAASMVRAMGIGGASAVLASLPDGAVLPLLDAAHGGRGRHRSIERALSASYMSLGDEDALLHERLSSLRGGFRTEDAVGVVDGPDVESVAAGLRRLSEASLVKQTGPDRWRVLEPVRQFGATRLLRRGERGVQAARHAAHFIDLASKAEVRLRGPDEKSWFLRLSEAYANLDKALSWAVESGDALGAQQLTSSLWWYWAAQGMFVEGTHAVERSLALGAPVPPALRVKTLVAVSHLCWWAGNPQRTETSLTEAMELISAIGEPDPGVVCLNGWAETGLAAAHLWGGGDYRVLAGHLEEGRKLFASIDNLPGLGLNLSTHSGVAWHYGHDLLHYIKATESLAAFEEAGHQTMIAHMTRVLGLALAQMGDFDLGRPLIQKGLQMSDDLGDKGGQPLGLAFLGLLELWAGNSEAAGEAFRGSITTNRGLGQVWPSLLAIGFGAEHAGSLGRPGDAIRLNAAMGKVTEMTGIRLPPHDLERVGVAVGRSEDLLAPHEVNKLASEGVEMSIPSSTALVLEVLQT